MDKNFRKFFTASRLGYLDNKEYKDLFLGWQDRLQEYQVFLDTILEYIKTDYVEKTFDKKKDICLNLIREDGKRVTVSMRSGLSDNLLRQESPVCIFFRPD